MSGKKHVARKVKKTALDAMVSRARQGKSAFYRLRSILGYDWAIYYFLLGGRMAGKSYAVLDLYLHQFFEYGRVFY